MQITDFASGKKDEYGDPVGVDVFKNYEVHLYTGLADKEDTKAGVYSFPSKFLPYETKNLARKNMVAVWDEATSKGGSSSRRRAKKDLDGYFQAVDAGGFTMTQVAGGPTPPAGFYTYTLKSHTSARTDIALEYDQKEIDPVATAEKVKKVSI